MPVPNSFANVTTSIPLSQLDANFNTPITLGNTAIQLGNTVTTLNNMTLANVTVTSGNVTITNVSVTTANVTTANIATAQIANVTVSGTGTFAAGSNTAPSITTSGDTNTGIFFPAADTIAFTEGGVESMRIDSSGNVGIGTISPASLLTVSGTRTGNPWTNGASLAIFSNLDTTNPATLKFTSGNPDNSAVEGQIVWGGIAGDGAFAFSNYSAERMRIDSSGVLNVLMTGAETGATNGFQFLSPAGNGGLTIYSSAATRDQIQLKDSVTTGPASGNTCALGVSAGALYAKTGGSERMRITSDGEVLVGGTNAISSAAGALTIQDATSASLNLFRNNTTVGTGGTVGGSIGFYGNDTTGNTPTLLAYIQGIASGTHAAGDNPTDIVFGTTPDGSATVAEAMRITQAKNLKIGGTASRATTEGTNQLVLFNGTAPVGTLTNGVSFYSAAGEARVMDAAGNSTLLSPHDQATNEWIFHSKHTPTGKVLRIDVEKMLRFINDHFGLDMVHEFTEEQS